MSEDECESCSGSGAQMVSDDPQPAYVGCSDCHGSGLKNHGANCEYCTPAKPTG